ncbi:MAG: hypothetical protein LUF01_15510 [Bacteroides sp.]|nr:hypothetical protein [Bacteroides sp.]
MPSVVGGAGRSGGTGAEASVGESKTCAASAASVGKSEASGACGASEGISACGAVVLLDTCKDGDGRASVGFILSFFVVGTGSEYCCECHGCGEESVMSHT